METKGNLQYHTYYYVLRNIQSETKQLINSIVKDEHVLLILLSGCDWILSNGSTSLQ